ncbi:MAG: hypothetical protein EOP53_14995 [Sphingobacteriales bacterium]|nr:MAG: hypothetical protein EOP53_14995 [Sphingobacteriales bacterium]
MKPAVVFLFLSIFFGLNSGIAQTNNGTYKLCNISGKKIALEELQYILKSDCGKIIYADSAGYELPITKFTFAFSPKESGNAYFEQVDGDIITQTIKERLKAAKPGDLIVFANIECMKNGTKALLEGSNYFITE